MGVGRNLSYKKELFIAKLQTKTGWGRNEIITLYEQSVTEAIMEMLED
jgi:hypothetical protein